MKKLVKTMALVTAALMLVTGCGKKEVKEASDNKLTYWVEFGNQISTGVNKMGELPQYKKMLEDLGLDVDFIHPVNGQVAEQLNLKIASGDLPDIIQYQFAESYPGGAAKALEDKVIIPLDLDRAPNLKKYLSEHPDIDRQVKLDDGTYYCFPNIYGDDYLLTYTGIIVRQDMLDKIGCQMPETIDEWTNVLTKAKNELGLRAPFTLALNSSSQSAYWLLSAFDLAPNFYVDNGKIKYAPNEDAMEEYVKVMADWYKKGLIDTNIANVDSKTIKQNMLNGDSIATVGNTGGGIGQWQPALEEIDPNANLQPAPFPTKVKGEKPFFGHRVNEYMSFGSACITPDCKNLDAAYKLLDYGYSDEGRMLFSFGIEGESYEMIDGYPTYTELITNNPEGKSFSDMIGIYTYPNGAAPSVRDGRYMEQFAALPAQKKSIEVWGDTHAKEHLLPPITFSSDESSRIAELKPEIDTYVETGVLKFISNIEPMEKYPAFKEGLKSLGIDEVLSIYQAAYERYEKI